VQDACIKKLSFTKLLIQAQYPHFRSIKNKNIYHVYDGIEEQESRAIAERTARRRYKFRNVWKFIVA